MTTLEKVEQVQSLRKQGMLVKDACEKVGISAPWFYTYSKKTKPKKAVKRKRKLVVQEFASIAQVQSKLFIVFGDAVSLQEFARGMQ